jgi:hypothetical protein
MRILPTLEPKLHPAPSTAVCVALLEAVAVLQVEADRTRVKDFNRVRAARKHSPTLWQAMLPTFSPDIVKRFYVNKPPLPVQNLLLVSQRAQSDRQRNINAYTGSSIT